MSDKPRAWRECPTCGKQHDGCYYWMCDHKGQLHKYIGGGDYYYWKDSFDPCPTCTAHFKAVDEAIRKTRRRGATR